MKSERPLRFIASSKNDLSEMPSDVKRVFGFALRMAKNGEKHAKAKLSLETKTSKVRACWRSLKTMTVRPIALSIQ
jgi:phage-related protein